mgnify:CR=1 FL=1
MAIFPNAKYAPAVTILCYVGSSWREDGTQSPRQPARLKITHFQHPGKQIRRNFDTGSSCQLSQSIGSGRMILEYDRSQLSKAELYEEA